MSCINDILNKLPVVLDVPAGDVSKEDSLHHAGIWDGSSSGLMTDSTFSTKCFILCKKKDELVDFKNASHFLPIMMDNR